MFINIGSFLEQDDLMCETYTPKELIREAALLRTNLTNEEIEEKTKNLITTLHLEECQDKISGGLFKSNSISGKERKRTALGIELMTDPHLIFLDEPTSGLDSENAFSMIKMLKRETKNRGGSVICTLHQPSSHLFKLFDRVICLSEGHVIY